MEASRLSWRGFSTSASDIETSLILNQNHEEIAAIVGEQYAETLRRLALDANQVQSRGGKRVLIVPGILGSTLAVANDTVWFDPIDIMRGKLKLLRLTGASDNVQANGVFWPTYAELYFKLKIAGYRAEYFPFDWRKPIVDAGKRLARFIVEQATAAQPLSLVAHSMGGLVCRAAIKELGARANTLIAETILLGTPNFGSFAPALVFTNDYSTVQWIERLDLVNANGALVRDVFTTFVGLAEMLPEKSATDSADLFDENSYPTAQRVVRKNVLHKADGLQARIAAGSDKIWMIAGVGIDTVVGVATDSTDPQKFRYRRSSAGDGTVPLSLAKLPGAHHRYCAVEHGKLPQDSEVIRATIDLLASRSTGRLSESPDDATRNFPRISASADRSRELLLQAVAEKRQGPAISNTELQIALEPLLSTKADQAQIPDSQVTNLPSTLPIVLGRKYQTRLDLKLTLGDISAARGKAIMLGFFKGVRPGGAAGALDKHLEGMLADVIDRRMFSANVGEIFILPVLQHELRAEMVVLIGLGNFGQFSAQSLRSSVENATRMLLRCNVDNLITVPLGGGSGLSMDEIANATIEGVSAALVDAVGRPSLRSFEIVTNNSTDFDRLNSGILPLVASSKFDRIEFTLEREARQSIAQASALPTVPRLISQHATTYLIVRESPNPQARNKGQFFVDVSVLGTGAKATVISDHIEIPENDLKQLLFRINDAKNSPGFFDKAAKLGQELANLVVPQVVRELLDKHKPDSVAIINDFWGSKIPWEILTIGSWRAGLNGNVSRKYSTANISVAKWLQSRRSEKELSMLLIYNPTDDLPGAKDEGERIRDILGKQQGIKLLPIQGADATKVRLAREFASGKYDLIHYAGHAYFDQANRSQSGILCAGEQVLSGRDLATLDSLPSLVVFNACETGRVRSAILPTRMRAATAKAFRQEQIDRNVSLAEAFLRGGVASFVGTYWPVGDSAAKTFASDFYSNLLQAHTMGESILSARTKLHSQKEADWVNYIHYGDAEFRVKLP